MPGGWTRPENVGFPTVWRTFERTIDGITKKFWVQDIPEDRIEDVVDAMYNHFTQDEPLCRYSKIAEDELSLEEMKYTWRMVLQDKVGLICLTDNPDSKGKPIIAGLNVTFIAEKDIPIPEFKGEKWRNLIDSCMYICKQVDAHEKFGVDAYLSAMGLLVLPEFRGKGIGLEILNARGELMKAVGLRATLTIFTATASQILAERSGFKDLYSLSYDELEERDKRFAFPGINEHTKHIRWMYKVID